MAGERKGQERQLLEVFTKCVHFCWQSEAGNVNWGQREVSVFTGPARSSAGGGGQRSSYPQLQLFLKKKDSVAQI